MSFYTTFETYGEVIEYLKNSDYPQCFRVNYLPKTKEFALWIGNQPYESYEEMIEDIEESLHIARVHNRDLHILVKSLKEEIEQYEKAVEEFKKEYDYEHGWQVRNVEGNKRSQWHKGALRGFNHVKSIFDKNFK